MTFAKSANLRRCRLGRPSRQRERRCRGPSCLALRGRAGSTRWVACWCRYGPITAIKRCLQFRKYRPVTGIGYRSVGAAACCAVGSGWIAGSIFRVVVSRHVRADGQQRRVSVHVLVRLMKFGKRLKEREHPDWVYLDYKVQEPNQTHTLLLVLPRSSHVTDRLDAHRH